MEGWDDGASALTKGLAVKAGRFNPSVALPLYRKGSILVLLGGNLLAVVVVDLVFPLVPSSAGILLLLDGCYLAPEEGMTVDGYEA